MNRKDKELTLTADAEPQLDAVKKVLVEKMIKRGVDPKCLDPQKLEQATHKTVRQKVKLKSGIDKDTAKTIQKAIKDLKLKVNASIQGEALRVSGSKKDDLQAVIAAPQGEPAGDPAAVHELPVRAGARCPSPMSDGRNNFDVIVVGVGSMGSAACYHLARRGAPCWGWSGTTFPTAWARPTATRG